MSASSAERAALLSARIHAAVNAGKLWISPDSVLWSDVNLTAATLHEAVGFFGECFEIARGYHGLWSQESPLIRLGAELRAIAMGNRGGA